MQQRLPAVRQIGVDDEREVRQVETARGDIGCDEHAGAAVAQRLQRMRALVLRQLARERDGGEAALDEARVHALHRLARGAEHERGTHLVEAQHVDDGVLDVVRGDADGAIFDVGVLLVAPQRLDADGVALVTARQALDLARHSGGEQQRLARLRRRVEDELQILAEAQVEHLVRLVQHDGLEARQIEAAALEVVAQAARGADDDVGAEAELARLGTRVHAADAGDDAGAGILVQPLELTLDLHRQLARRRDDEGERGGRRRQALLGAEQHRGNAEAEGHRLAGAGLSRDEEIAPGPFGFEDGGLHGRCGGVAARGKSAPERGMNRREGHFR